MGDRAGERAVQFGRVAVDGRGVARMQRSAERGEPLFDRVEHVFQVRPRRAGGHHDGRRGVQRDPLLSSSWALAISLSAMTSGSILNDPSAMA